MMIYPKTYGEHFVSKTLRNDAADGKQTLSVLPHDAEEMIRCLDHAERSSHFLKQTEQQLEKALPDALDKLLSGFNKKIDIQVKL